MSYRSQLSGATVYRPDKVTVPQHMLIDPTATPMDEVWRFIRTCCAVWLAKWNVWSYNQEDIDELEQSCYGRTFYTLVYKVQTHKYNKNLSFYLNVRSCAWSSVATEVRNWLPRIQNKLNNVNIDKVIGRDASHGELHLIDTLSERPIWRTSSEYNTNKQKALSLVNATQRDACTVRRIVDNDYASYLDDCTEFQVEDVLSIDEFIRNNYSDRVYEIYHTDASSHEYRSKHYKRKKTAK